MARFGFSFRPDRASRVAPAPPPARAAGAPPLRPNPAPSRHPDAALAEFLLHPITRPWAGNAMPAGEEQFFGNDEAWVAAWAVRPEEREALAARAPGKPYPASYVRQRLGEFSSSSHGVYSLGWYDPERDSATFESLDGEDETTRSFGALRTVAQVLARAWDKATVTEEGDVCLWLNGHVVAAVFADPAAAGSWPPDAGDDAIGGDVEDAGDEEGDVEPASYRHQRLRREPSGDDLDPSRAHPNDLNDALWNELAELEAIDLESLAGVFPYAGASGTAYLSIYGAVDYEEFEEVQIGFEVVAERDGHFDLRITENGRTHEGISDFYDVLASRSGVDREEEGVAALVNTIELDYVGREVADIVAEQEGMHGVMEMMCHGHPVALVVRSTDRRVVAYAMSINEGLYLRDQGNAGRRDPRLSGAAAGRERIVDAEGLIDEARVAAHFPEGSVVVLDTGRADRPTFLGLFQVAGGALWALLTVEGRAYLDYEKGVGESLVLPAEPVSWDAWRRDFYDRFGFPPVVTAATLDPVFPARYGVPYRSTGRGSPPARLPSPAPAGPAWPRAAPGVGSGAGAPALPAGLDPVPADGALVRARRGAGPVARGASRALRDLVTGDALLVPDGSTALLPPEGMDLARPGWLRGDNQLLFHRLGAGADYSAAPGVLASTGAGVALVPVAESAGTMEFHAAVPIAEPPQLRLRDLVTGADYQMPADAELPAAPQQMDVSAAAWQGQDGWVRYLDVGGSWQVAALQPTAIVSAAWPVLAAVSGPGGAGEYTLHAMVVMRGDS